MPRFASWKTVLLVVSVAFATILVACGGNSSESPASTSPETVEVPTRWASATAATLPSLVQSSDEVFFGRVTRVIGQQEIDVGPRGRGTLPVTSFEVNVTTALGGTLASGSTVVIEQVGGTTEISGGEQASIVLEGDRLLEAGAEYLFFAQYKSNGNLGSPPFGRLQVGGDGALTALPRWSNLGALQQLSQVTAAQAASEINAAR